MIAIKDLLLKFNDILLSKESKVKSVQDVLNQTIGLEVKKEDIRIKNNTVYLNIKPIYKNEIFINKEKIVSILEKTLGQKHPGDIR